MEDRSDQLVEQLVQRVRDKDLSRGEFAKILAGMGASASGIALLLASTGNAFAAQSGSGKSKVGAQTHAHHQMKLHHSHVQRQGLATHAPGGKVNASGAKSVDPSVHAFRAQKLKEIMADYADNAVVEDPLMDGPIVGKKAIADRKISEMTAMHGVTIAVANRFAHQNQVVAEWVLRGTHQGHYMGYAPTGRTIEIRGMTVVTRENHKITKESLYYDLAELHRQLA